MSVAERAEVRKLLSGIVPKVSAASASPFQPGAVVVPNADDEDLWCAFVGEPQSAYVLELPATAGGKALPGATIFASPHSGRFYPAEFLRIANCELPGLRQFEDAFVDHLFAAAPEVGAAFLQAQYARAFIDLNRSEDDIDPEMLVDSDGATLPSMGRAQSHRVRAGLGIVPRLAADGRPLYPGQMTFSEISRRIASAYTPYHARLAELMGTARARFGGALLIDCHSMPALPIPGLRATRQPDIVVGDRFGQSAHPRIVARIETIFRKMGYRVARNTPYAGGYVTHHYGLPEDNRHAVQIEVNRGLYLDEDGHRPGPGFAPLARDLHRFCAEVVALGEDIHLFSG